MTFKKFEEVFKQKYPDGRVWMHDEFEHGQRGKRQKVAVVFNPNSKVYMYAGAYEDVLCKVGINCISKERFTELEHRLAYYQKLDGKEDFFGGVFDCKADIQQLTDEIENYKKNWIIA